MNKNKKAPARARAKVEYLLTTKLFCGHCKEMMTGLVLVKWVRFTDNCNCRSRKRHNQYEIFKKAIEHRGLKAYYDKETSIC